MKFITEAVRTELQKKYTDSIEEPLGYDEAAQFLGLKKSSLYTLREKYPHHKVGKRVYFYKSELKKNKLNKV